MAEPDAMGASFQNLAVLTFSCVPMQEGLSSEHGSELLRDPFEYLLNGSGVSNKCGTH